MPSTILRFGIPYGPRARPAAVLPIFVNKALAGEPLTIAGDGSQSRRFVYVEDLAEGVVAALAPWPPAASTTSSAARTSRCATSPTASRTPSAPWRSCTPRAARATSPAPACRAPAPRRSSAGPRRRSFREGVRRYVDWHRERRRRGRPRSRAAPVARRLPSLRTVAVDGRARRGRRVRRARLRRGDRRDGPRPAGRPAPSASSPRSPCICTTAADRLLLEPPVVDAGRDRPAAAARPARSRTRPRHGAPRRRAARARRRRRRLVLAILTGGRRAVRSLEPARDLA